MDYRIDHENLTIICIDRNGESHDMNAGGDPCESLYHVLELADACGLKICSFANPIDDEIIGMDVVEASEVMEEDPSLIYLID